MVLDIVEILLKHLSHQYVRLDGSTPMAERLACMLLTIYKFFLYISFPYGLILLSLHNVIFGNFPLYCLELAL